MTTLPRLLESIKDSFDEHVKELSAQNSALSFWDRCAEEEALLNVVGHDIPRVRQQLIEVQEQTRAWSDWLFHLENTFRDTSNDILQRLAKLEHAHFERAKATLEQQFIGRVEMLKKIARGEQRGQERFPYQPPAMARTELTDAGELNYEGTENGEALPTYRDLRQPYVPDPIVLAHSLEGVPSVVFQLNKLLDTPVERVVFDTQRHGWKHDDFFDAVSLCERYAIVNFTSRGYVFGAYIQEKLTSRMQWVQDENHFVFLLRSPVPSAQTPCRLFKNQRLKYWKKAIIFSQNSPKTK